MYKIKNYYSINWLTCVNTTRLLNLVVVIYSYKPYLPYFSPVTQKFVSRVSNYKFNQYFNANKNYRSNSPLSILPLEKKLFSEKNITGG